MAVLKRINFWSINYCRTISRSAVLGARKGDDYYLQQSKIPTMHFQPSLPRLPIPKLADSCQRYLAAQRPILSDKEYETTTQLTEEFSKDRSDGWELNQRLIMQDQNNKHTSFIADYWYDMYLKDRRSIVLNQNPFALFKEDPRNPSQTDRAAQLIHSIVRFHNSLKDNKLRPEVYHLDPTKSDKNWFNLLRFIPGSLAWYGSYMINAFPLDMVQYTKLFNSTRIPRETRDELVSYPGTRHVLVLHNDHMYCVDVIQPNGYPVDINYIQASLEAIKADVTPSPAHPMSFLTTLGRSEWSKAREELILNSRNLEMIEKVDSALFVLCLDESQPTEHLEATRVFLHNNGHNRWFDKSIQFIVTSDGTAGMNFEHSWGDGVAVIRLFNEIYEETTQRPRPLTPPTSPAPLPERLDFELTDGVRSAIEVGRTKINELANSLSVNVMRYEKYGKNYLKSKKLSPDGVCQLAFQIAYYYQYKISPSTYESCSTAGFRHGRTETIRPASVPTMKCAMAFEPNSGASVSDKIKLIKEAISWHSKLVREAATGQGFDRHLFALKSLAESEKLSLPIFADPSYTKLNTIVLSTSTLPSDAVLFGGFAPVNPDSYGLGYVVLDNHFGANALTYPTRDGQLFIANLTKVLDEMYSLLESPEYKL